MIQRSLLLGVVGLVLTLSGLGCGREGASTIHAARRRDRRIPPRVTGLEPVPAGETAPPASPAESFQAAGEPERIERPPSAEELRFAEEQEKRERQRSQEQVRTVEQYERAARGE
jgi:hypothetical protein